MLGFTLLRVQEDCVVCEDLDMEEKGRKMGHSKDNSLIFLLPFPDYSSFGFIKSS